MATLGNILKGNNPLSQMKQMEGVSQSMRFPDKFMGPDIAFNPTQRLDNQLKTASQVQDYAASKSMNGQTRTDMRGNVAGYADTLG